jgi:hypothetical protein
MLYDHHPSSHADRSGDSAPEPDARELLEDLSALVDAGLVVPLQGADGEVRVVPADPFDLDAEIDPYDQRS